MARLILSFFRMISLRRRTHTDSEASKESSPLTWWRIVSRVGLLGIGLAALWFWNAADLLQLGNGIDMQSPSVILPVSVLLLALVFIAWTTWDLLAARRAGDKRRKGPPKSAPAVIALAIVGIQFGKLLLGESASFELAALLFLPVAFLFRGSLALWWTFIVPVGGFFLLYPIFSFEMNGASAAALLHAALGPGLSWLACAVLAPTLENRDRVSDLRRDVIEIERHQRTMVSGFQNLTAAIGDLMEHAPLKMITEEFAVAPKPADAIAADRNDAEPTLTFKQFHQLVRRSVEDVRERYSAWNGLRLMLVGPADPDLPILLRAEVSSLELVLTTILENSIDSLGARQGIIRVNIRPALGVVSLLIEDNGRGLAESQAAKQGRMNLLQTRSFAESVDWRMETVARLGVGTRVTLVIPRVDQAAIAERPAAERVAGSDVFNRRLVAAAGPQTPANPDAGSKPS